MTEIPKFIIGANLIERDETKNMAVPIYVNKLVDKFGMYDAIRIQTKENHQATAEIVIAKLLNTGSFVRKGKIKLVKGINNKCKKCGNKMIYEQEDEEVIEDTICCENEECDNKKLETFDVIEYLLEKIPAAKRH